MRGTWLERLLGSAPGVIWGASGADVTSLRLEHVSASVTTLLGYTPEECLGRGSWLEITHADDKGRVTSCLASALAGPGQSASVKARWRARGGSYRHVDLRCSALVDADGRVEGVCGLVLEAGPDVRSEVADRRLAFLARASAELAGSLDLAVTLERVAHLAVPEFADWCVVRVAENGRLGRPVVWHGDPERRAWAYAINARYPVNHDAPRGPAAVFRTGRSELVPVVTEAMIQAAAGGDPEVLSILRQLDIHSSLTVALQSREGPVGVLSLTSCRPDLHYGEEDLRFAEDLGRRCGSAVENARLYGARQQAEAALQRHARRLELAAEVGRFALAQPGLEDLLQRICNVVAQALELDAVGMDELGADGALRIRTGIGWAEENVGLSVPSGPTESLSGYTFHSQRTVTSNDLDEEPRFVRSPRLAAVGARSAIATPILVDGSPVGTLMGACSRKRNWEPEEQAFIETIAHLLAAGYERQANIAKLREEKERLAVTLRSIGDGVIATDMRGRVVLLNSVAESLTGWSQAEAMGRSVNEVFHIVNQRTREPRQSPVERVLSTGAIVGLANHTALIAKDGSERAIADSGAPIRDAQGNVSGVVLVFRDVTEHDRVQAELQRANTLESVGVLAGGIAHDFNNILTGITANLSLARLRLDPSDRVHQRITEAERAAVRARELTQQLLTFAKGGSPQRQLTSIQELVRETVGFVLTGSNVRANLDLPPDVWVVEADAGQISQVLQNLVLNAQQAMPEGGSVSVTLANAVLQEPTGLPLPGGAYVRLDVSDHGVGIPPQHLSRVFDPFFTTKQRGSGLGLATAYAIVQKHDGHISVRSTLGVGTQFSVFLPAAPGALAIPALELPVDPGPTRAGRILVMDDEKVIRDALRSICEELGFECEVAADGSEAVARYRGARANGTPFDLVILDLTVPGGMGGRETFADLRRLDPGVRAIVSSGYSDDALMSDYRSAGFLDAMAKPYTLEEVVRVLRRVLP